MKAGTLDCDTHTYYGYHNHKVVPWTNEDLHRNCANSKVYRFIINKGVWILHKPLYLYTLSTSIFNKAPIEYYRFIYNFIYPITNDLELQYQSSAKYYNSVAKTLIYPCLYKYVGYVDIIQRIQSLINQSETFYTRYCNCIIDVLRAITCNRYYISNKEDVYYLFESGQNVYFVIDYWKMRDKVKEYVNLPKYPKNLNYCHDKAHIYYNKYINEIEKQQIKLMDENYQKNVYSKAKSFEYNDTNFVIKAPISLMELNNEGNLLNHCVASYKDSISEGKEYILFLRKQNDPDKPYFTIDVTSNKHVRQIHGFNNCNIENDVLRQFVENWGKAFNLIFDKNTIKTAL